MGFSDLSAACCVSITPGQVYSTTVLESQLEYVSVFDEIRFSFGQRHENYSVNLPLYPWGLLVTSARDSRLT